MTQTLSPTSQFSIGAVCLNWERKRSTSSHLQCPGFDASPSHLHRRRLQQPSSAAVPSAMFGIGRRKRRPKSLSLAQFFIPFTTLRTYIALSLATLRSHSPRSFARKLADSPRALNPRRHSSTNFPFFELQEKFEDLRSTKCNLIGPQCVLFCAKEQ